MTTGSRRARTIAGGGVLVAAAAVAAAAALSGGEDGDRASAAGSSSSATTTIRRRDLVEVSSEDGTLGYSDSRPVVNRLAGTVTWLPGVGASVRTGRRLYEVDGHAVYLLDGGRPAYRELRPGLTGVDVRQLERNLRALGFDAGRAMTVNRTWDAGTTAAVKRFQSARSMAATGRIALGRVVFAPGTRRVSSLAVTLGSSTAGGGGGSTTRGAVDGGAASSDSMRFASYVRVADEPVPSGPTGPTGPTGPAGPSAPAPTRPSEPATSPPSTRGTSDTPSARGEAGGRSQPSAAPRARSAQSGQGAGGGGSTTQEAASTVATALMRTTSTRRIVTVALDTAKQSLARAGARVEVELPSGDVVRGRIARVGTVAEQATGADGQDSGPPTIRVVVKLSAQNRAATLDQAPVSVRLEQRRRDDVLAIPVTALLARRGGQFAVEVVEGSQRRIVAVTTGLYTSGYVEVRGAGLREGMRVADARV